MRVDFKFGKLAERATHKETLLKFIGLLAVLCGYIVYLSFEFGAATSLYVAALSWSFFVLCTPVADAGFLLDFPLRLLFGWRMVISEIFVWALAIAINIWAVFFDPVIYQSTPLTGLFHKILVNPAPNWIIILISAAGTFLSIIFGDEMLDVVSHHQRTTYHAHHLKYRFLALAGVIALSLAAYYYVLNQMGIDISTLAG